MVILDVRRYGEVVVLGYFVVVSDDEIVVMDCGGLRIVVEVEEEEVHFWLEIFLVCACLGSESGRGGFQTAYRDHLLLVGNSIVVDFFDEPGTFLSESSDHQALGEHH